MLDMHVEVPFVPAAARRPKVLETHAEDTIVIVGQTRPKKRKRNSKKFTEQAESCEILAVPGNEDEDHGAASMSKPLGEKEKPEIVMETGETSDEQEDFDFTAVPNTKKGTRSQKDSSHKIRGKLKVDHLLLFTRILANERQ